ncbi:MAG: hypothetical protein ACI8ZM_003635 [Crocinitomix sp.]
MNSTGKYIRIERIFYEEPYLLNLIFKASNGYQTGELEIYVHPEDLSELAGNINNFPQSLKHEYPWVFGSENKADNFAYYFKLLFCPIDAGGNCNLVVSMNNNESDLRELEVSHFTIKCSTEELNMLSILLLKFSGASKQGLQSCTVLEWSGSDGSVY